MSKKKMKIGLFSILMVLQISVLGGQVRIQADEQQQNELVSEDVTQATTTEEAIQTQEVVQTPDTTQTTETTQTPEVTSQDEKVVDNSVYAETLKAKIESIYTNEAGDTDLYELQFTTDIESQNLYILDRVTPFDKASTGTDISLQSVSITPQDWVLKYGRISLVAGADTDASTLEAMGHNILVGTTMNGSEVTLGTNYPVNGGNTDFSYDNYKKLELRFDTPVQFISGKGASDFKVSFGGKFDVENADYLAYKADSVQEMKNQVILTSVEYDNNTLTAQGERNVNKGLSKAIEYSLTLEGPYGTPELEFGDTGYIQAKYYFSNTNHLVDSSVQNPIVYFVLPQGIILDEERIDGSEGLDNITLVRNMNGSGRNVIYGTPDTPLNSVPQVHGIFSIPVTADMTLQTNDDYKIQTYLSFKNNDGVVSLSDPRSRTDFILDQSDPIAIDLGLYKDSNNPNKTLGREISFSYTAPLTADASMSVKKDGDSTYVQDTGATLDSGDRVNYRMNVMNNTGEDIYDLYTINVLPRVGDMFQIPNPDGSMESRGSQFNVYLDGPVSVPEGYEALYSTDTPSNDGSMNELANWVSDPGDPDFYASVTMVLVYMYDQTIPNGSDVNFYYDAILENDVTIPDGSIAVNTFVTSTNTPKRSVKTDAQTRISRIPFAESTPATVRISYPTADINVFKTDADNQTLGLSGAEFQLYTFDTDELLLNGQTFTSDETGHVIIPSLKPGSYYLKETVAPVGYVSNTNEKEMNQFVVERQTEDTLSLNITNEKANGSIIEVSPGTAAINSLPYLLILGGVAGTIFMISYRKKNKSLK